MKNKNKKKIIDKNDTRETSLGVFLLSFSLLLLLSLIFYSPLDRGFFIESSNECSNILGSFGSYTADLFLQVFGLFSFVISILLFIWGCNFISGKIHYIKHKYTVFLAFIFLGCVVLNIVSSNSFGIKIMDKLRMDYYAGGFIGYILTKIIYIDLLRHSEFWKFGFWAMVISWIFIAKKALFINFDSMKEQAPKMLSLLKEQVLVKIKNSKNKKNDSVWQDIPNIVLDDYEETQETEYYEQSPEHGYDDAAVMENHPMTYNEDISGLVLGGGTYVLPSPELLERHSQKATIQDEGKIAVLSAELCNVLEEFGVKGEILHVRQGPVVTMFEFRPAPGIKTSRVISLSDDIARSMSAISTRISTIPGQNAIGIELPNKERLTVYLRELLSSEAFRNFSTGIPLILGKDISGNPVMADLAKMPHLLVAGTTGSGKSVSINDMILSILFKFSPEECKLIMIDPKMLELSVYDEIPHLLTPVVTDPKKAVFALKWAVAEMENRYRQMSKLGVRNIDGFNKKLKESKEKGELLVRKIQTGFDQDTGRPIFETQQLEFETMPYIVVIVDEMADLMLVAGKEIESAVQRLAQMARAAGIHIIMATQRPSVDVITGTIKANFPTRISFQVTSKIDSRTILGEQGAEQLLGQGDMLYMSGAGRIVRIHGPFVKDSEVEKIVSYIKGQGEPNYVDVISDSFSEEETFGTGQSSDSDDMYKKAIEIILNDKKVSISYLQRKLQIGYNRAARIIEEMEGKGVVSAPNHSGKREILI